MQQDVVRIGRISSIHYKRGMVKVVYTDKEGCVTDELPVLNMNGEYKMPQVDDMVLVLHLSNGSAMGVVIGTIWNDENKPYETGKGVYRKELGGLKNQACITFHEETGETRIRSEHIIFEAYGDGATISLGQLKRILEQQE